jgi:hypothetical protein
MKTSRLLHRRNQTTLQWLQNPSHINGHHLNNTVSETSKPFRNKGNVQRPNHRIWNRERIKILKHLYESKNEFKRSYQLRSNLVKDEDHDDLPTDSHSILIMWKIITLSLSNVNAANNVR